MLSPLSSYQEVPWHSTWLPLTLSYHTIRFGGTRETKHCIHEKPIKSLHIFIIEILLFCWYWKNCLNSHFKRNWKALQSTLVILNTRHLELSLCQTIFFGPLNFSTNSRLKNACYLELRYLELSLSRTNYLLPWTAFCSVSRTFVQIFEKLSKKKMNFHSKNNFH